MNKNKNNFERPADNYSLSTYITMVLAKFAAQENTTNDREEEKEPLPSVEVLDIDSFPTLVLNGRKLTLEEVLNSDTHGYEQLIQKIVKDYDPNSGQKYVLLFPDGSIHDTSQLVRVSDTISILIIDHHGPGYSERFTLGAPCAQVFGVLNDAEEVLGLSGAKYIPVMENLVSVDSDWLSCWLETEIKENDPEFFKKYYDVLQLVFAIIGVQDMYSGVISNDHFPGNWQRLARIIRPILLPLGEVIHLRQMFKDGLTPENKLYFEKCLKNLRELFKERIPLIHKLLEESNPRHSEIVRKAVIKNLNQQKYQNLDPEDLRSGFQYTPTYVHQILSLWGQSLDESAFKSLVDAFESMEKIIVDTGSLADTPLTMVGDTVMANLGGKVQFQELTSIEGQVVKHYYPPVTDEFDLGEIYNYQIGPHVMTFAPRDTLNMRSAVFNKPWLQIQINQLTNRIHKYKIEVQDLIESKLPLFDQVEKLRIKELTAVVSEDSLDEVGKKYKNYTQKEIAKLKIQIDYYKDEIGKRLTLQQQCVEYIEKLRTVQDNYIKPPISLTIGNRLANDPEKSSITHHTVEPLSLTSQESKKVIQFHTLWREILSDIGNHVFGGEYRIRVQGGAIGGARVEGLPKQSTEDKKKDTEYRSWPHDAIIIFTMVMSYLQYGDNFAREKEFEDLDLSFLSKFITGDQIDVIEKHTLFTAFYMTLFEHPDVFKGLSELMEETEIFEIYRQECMA